jgi:hypothetical protein
MDNSNEYKHVWNDYFRDIVILSIANIGIREFAMIDSISSVRFLDLSYNVLPSFKTCIIGRGRGCNENSIFPNLTALHLKSNQLKSLENVCLPTLKLLDVSDNQIHITAYDAGARFWGFALFEVDLSGNRFFFFKSFSQWLAQSVTQKIEHLYTDDSDLSLVHESIFLTHFGELTSLKTLSLAHTLISSITPKMFEAFTNLTTLDLNKNAITHIPDGCFDSLTHLKYLFLSSNAISNVQATAFSEKTRHRLHKLILSNNPFKCTCELLDFRDWYLKDSSHIFSGSVSDSYDCTTPDGTKQRLESFTMVHQAYLVSRVASILIIVVVTSLLCSGMTFIALFRYRWHFRLYMYEAFRGQGDRRRRYLEEGNFAYDVFVLYDSEQQPWVLRHLKPRLERGLGLRLCLHYRDFIPGKNIVDNIVHCVESSKKILMVFSNDFVHSQWCQFELAYCLSHVMDCEDALIIM